jgi:hypothetical protein
MLRTDPVIVESRPPAPPDRRPRGKVDKVQPVEVSAAAEPMSGAIAYNWSKLTSGRPRHAFWLLLMPYTFINVAGWMLPPRQRSKEEPPGPSEMGTTAARWLDVVIRLSGGVVTAIFTLFASAILIDLVAAKCQPGTDTCPGLRSFPEFTPGKWLFISTAAALVLTIGMGLFVGLERGRGAQSKRAQARLRQFGGGIPAPAPDEGDPAATLTVTDPTMWLHRKISLQLVYTHLGIAAVTLAWVLTTIRWNTTSGTPARLWVVVAGTLVIGAVLVLASSQRYSKAMATMSLVAAGAGLAAYIVAAIDAAGLSNEGWANIAVEEGLSLTSVSLTAIITFAGAIIWSVGGLSKKYSTSGSAALVVLAGLVGGSFGAGMYTLVHGALSSGDESTTVAPLGGMDWAALGFLVYLLILIGFALWTMVRDKLVTETGKNLTSEGLRTVTTKLRGHLGWPALAGLAGAAYFVGWSIWHEGAAIPSPFAAIEDATRVILVGLSIAVLMLLVGFVYRYFTWKVALAFAIAITALYLLVSFGKITEVNVLGASVRFDSLRELTVSLALLVPIGFIGSRLLSTFRSREQRRGIAILWDLGSFWPRWYHPFAAPPYTSVAVPDLAALIYEKADNDGRVLVSAHSQGSIISMAALLAIDKDDEVWERVAYLTYGNPVCHLYSRLFPGHFNADAISAVSERLGGEPGSCDQVVAPESGARPRWRNLWRQSDPIGGDIGVPGVSSGPVLERIEDGHSVYEATDAFYAARSELIAEIL